MGEVEIAALLCAFLAGSEAETHRYFDVNGMRRHVRVDCETAEHVIEIGLDEKSSSRDSLHQALFAAHLTGKIPVVILIDRDGAEGRFEFEMRHVTRAAGVAYATCREGFVQRWAMTQVLRAAPEGLDDLPPGAIAASQCDLALALGRRPAS
jgi:hypothetical protein